MGRELLEHSWTVISYNWSLSRSLIHVIEVTGTIEDAEIYFRDTIRNESILAIIPGCHGEGSKTFGLNWNDSL